MVLEGPHTTIKQITYLSVPELDGLFPFRQAKKSRMTGQKVTLSQDPVIKIPSSLDPDSLSQNARVANGPVCPLKILSVLPV
jgi:hypothetical protein